MSNTAAALLVLVLYLLHQDVWWWSAAHPIVFGVLPIGLFYHVVYTIGCAVALGVIVRRCWPAHLDMGAAGE